MTLLEATNENARAVSLPPGCISTLNHSLNLHVSMYIHVYVCTPTSDIVHFSEYYVIVFHDIVRINLPEQNISNIYY